MSCPEIVFGAASFGDSFANAEDAKEVLSLLKDFGISRIDTAARYPPPAPGRSEELLGEAGAANEGFIIDTKVLALEGDGSGELEDHAIQKSILTSRNRLGIESLNVLYCHRSDPSTPLQSQAASFDALYRQGHFKKLGVSNFSPETLKELLEICDKHGYIKPTVYQGHYSAVTRGSEKLLFPLLRKNDIAYYASRPLSSGFLTGKFSAGAHEETRFGQDDPVGEAMRAQFSSEVLHSAIASLNKKTDSAGLSMTEAALRWLAYHSGLRSGDAIILGASKLGQIRSNVEAIRKGPLTGDLPEVFEALWEKIEHLRKDII